MQLERAKLRPARSPLEMTTNRILLAVDQSPASSKATAYVGDLLKDSDRHFVHLCHVLPATAPFDPYEGLDEDGPASRGRDDAQLDVLPRRRTAVHPAFERARRALVEAGLAEDHIELDLCEPEPLQSVADALLAEAREHGCDTIVVGRSDLPWYRRVVRRHLGDELIDRATGLSVWIVE